MFRTFKTWTAPVRAMRFDGDLEAATEAVRAEVGREVRMPVLSEGMWILISEGVVTGLPDSVFRRCYVTPDAEIVEVHELGGAVHTTEIAPRTCFDCVHLANISSGSFCSEFREPIDSEIVAARDCEEYTPHD